MNKPRVSIIVLNWNGWKDTIECLESLYRITYSNYDIIIVDNGSKDKSIQKIKEYAEGKIEVDSKFFKYDPGNKPIKVFEITKDEARKGDFNHQLYEKYNVNRRLILIKNEDNYGYTGGNNIGIKFALKILNSDYLLLLNNDVIVDREFLSGLIKVTITEPRIGIVGPKTYLYNDPNRLWLAWFKMNMKRGKPVLIGSGQVDDTRYDQMKQVDYITGSCLLIRRQVVENIGLLDERYFSYWDETDYCLCARKAGYSIIYVPKAKIWHKVSSTTSKAHGLAEYYLTRNRFLFMKKHANDKQLDSFLLWFFLVDLWLKTGSILIRHRDIKTLKYFYNGIKDGILTLLASKSSKITDLLKKLYQSWALMYYLNFNKAMEAMLVSKLLNAKKNERILDVGCGNGVLCRNLLKQSCEIHGIDINVRAIDAAKIVTNKRCDFLVGNGETLPYRSKLFDKVTCVCALEHFKDDEKALAEMCRVLKVGGVLVLTVDSFTYRGIKNCLKEKHRKDHRVVNYYSISQLKKKLHNVGLKIIEHRFLINSPVSSFFFKLGIRNKFGYTYKAVFIPAYILSVVSDIFLGKKNEGYLLAVKAVKEA